MRSANGNVVENPTEKDLSTPLGVVTALKHAKDYGTNAEFWDLLKRIYEMRQAVDARVEARH